MFIEISFHFSYPTLSFQRSTDVELKERKEKLFRLVLIEEKGKRKTREEESIV